MKTPSLNVLLQFPCTAFYELMDKMSGISIFNSITLTDETYSADMTCPISSANDVFTGLIAVGATIANVGSETSVVAATAPVKSYIKKRPGRPRKTETGEITNKERGSGTKSKIGQMKELLLVWKSVQQLRKATGWRASTVHARLTGLRKKNTIESKNGTNGKMVYRIAA